MVGGDVVDTIGGDLAQLRDLEIVDADRFGIALGTQLPARVPEVADQFLLLGVDRDGRFARRDRRLDRGVDVHELGIAVGMAGPLAGLAVGLTAVLQGAQQPADQFLADFEALAAQSLGDVPLAAADPAQWRFRVAADRILNQGLQRREQPRLSFDGALAPAARTPDRAAQIIVPGLQFGHAAIDCAARHSSRRRHSRHTAMTPRQRLARHKQPAPALVQERRHLLIAGTNSINVNHAGIIQLPHPVCLRYLDSILALFAPIRFLYFASDPKLRLRKPGPCRACRMRPTRPWLRRIRRP